MTRKNLPSESVVRSAVMFVKTMSDHVDAKAGKPPTRETQKRVAKIVKDQFFSSDKIDGKP
jgi:hypothetical protein